MPIPVQYSRLNTVEAMESTQDLPNSTVGPFCTKSSMAPSPLPCTFAPLLHHRTYSPQPTLPAAEFIQAPARELHHSRLKLLQAAEADLPQVGLQCLHARLAKLQRKGKVSLFLSGEEQAHNKISIAISLLVVARSWYEI